jgi:hypothetical protein
MTDLTHLTDDELRALHEQLHEQLAALLPVIGEADASNPEHVAAGRDLAGQLLEVRKEKMKRGLPPWMGNDGVLK